MNILEILKSEAVDLDKEMERFAPRDFTDWSENVLGDIKWGVDVSALNGAIANPIWDLLDRGGKRWRPFLMKLCYDAVGGEGDILKYMVIPEVIHNGTLMVDDVEDGSDLRRGKPCVHKIYGLDIGINAGNAMYFLPMLSLMDDDLDEKTKVRIYEMVCREMVQLSLGQAMDIFWHGGGGMPGRKEYLQMCAFKTGTLARLAAKLGGMLAGASDETVKALGDFAEALGVAFQIQDDILNICPGEDWGKDFGDDISEGKRTLIVLRALEVLGEEDSKDLIGILNMQTKNKVIIGEAIGILKNSGAIDYCSEVARDMVREAWEKLDKQLDEGEAKAKLRAFCDFIVERDI